MLTQLRRFFTSRLLTLIGQRRFEWIRYHYYRLFIPDFGYSPDYYEGIQAANSSYYDLLAKTLVAEFHPRVLIDCGCGHGGISQAFLSNGCESAFLFDGSRHAVEIAKSKGLKHVEQIDFTTAAHIPAQGDLAICLEVAEHLPAEFAENLCRIVAETAPNVVFTAAPPGRGGHLHVNTQPQSYWIELFAKFGHEFDPSSVERVRTAFAGRMLEDYDAHLMIFRKKRNT